MQRFAFIVCLLACLETAGAHPHNYVDQQALLSVGANTVDVNIRIVPSFENGAAIFAAIDADGNGVVSQAEAAAFAAAVVANTSLEVDGNSIALQNATATVPYIDKVAAGFGIIEVDASAWFALSGVGEHQIAFAISYDDFSHDWQVQPFFYTDFAETISAQTVARSATGNHKVTIRFELKTGV